MTTNYCLLGCLKKTLMATPLLKMIPPQKKLKGKRMCFDVLPQWSSLKQTDDELLLARLLETDTDGDTTAEDDTSTEDTEGNTDVL